jgi:hypothetical protein
MAADGQLQDPEVLRWARVMRTDEVVCKAAPVEEILGVVRRLWRRGERR